MSNTWQNIQRKGLHAAVKSGHLEEVKALLKAGADPESRDTYGDVPLGIAVDLGKTSIVEVLLEAGANPELGNWTSPLEAAAINGHDDIVKLLIWAGADVNLKLNSEGTTLMSASAFGCLDIRLYWK